MTSEITIEITLQDGRKLRGQGQRPWDAACDAFTRRDGSEDWIDGCTDSTWISVDWPDHIVDGQHATKWTARRGTVDACEWVFDEFGACVGHRKVLRGTWRCLSKAEAARAA